MVLVLTFLWGVAGSAADDRLVAGRAMIEHLCNHFQRYSELLSLVARFWTRHTPVCRLCSLTPDGNGLMTSDQRYRSILLFGPPGVGKGTQGGILANIPGFFHLSVGDVFRAIDIGSPDGKEVYDYISRGVLVPDSLTISIWKKAVDAYIALSRYKPREDLLVLDGMPRNVAQVEIVREHLNIQGVIYLECSDPEDMIHRIRRRAIRENRADDANEDVIRHRFVVYGEVTAPVLEQFPSSIVDRVDANGSPAEVLYAILKSIIPVQNKLFEADQDD